MFEGAARRFSSYSMASRPPEHRPARPSRDGSMKLSVLSSDEVVAGYDAVNRPYPHIPPVSMRFFQLLWPRVRDVVGVDVDGGIIESACRSGIYREAHAAPAHRLPVRPETFASAFANCSLERMVHFPEARRGISLFLDHLWHVPRPAGELGDALFPFLSTLSDFRAVFGQVLMGIMRMDWDWSIGSGAAFQARRKP